jgi:hypothetical protein
MQRLVTWKCSKVNIQANWAARPPAVTGHPERDPGRLALLLSARGCRLGGSQFFRSLSVPYRRSRFTSAASRRHLSRV